MTEPRLQRRLAAILAADVVGYSRMMGVDEAGTLAALRTRWKDVLTPAVAHHRGRVVKVMGDGVLVEFGSAVDAVECALALQAGFAAANEGVAEDRRVTLRIGINLGDVMVEGADLYGDGVNIAARLEGIAQPGGIVVSAKVRDEAMGKTAAAFADMGDQALKNMTAPVRAYSITTVPAAASSAPAVDDRLSVAVLPFTSISADPDQQYFGDGVTEDIITELARVPVLRVASRNGSFRFRGPDADLGAAARTLGVRYIVEGSVRRLGSRIRITAQLVDTTSGAHLWAERYDRPADDIFDVQDEVVRTIVGTLTGRLQAAGAEVARRRPPVSLAAYDLVLRAEHSDWSDASTRNEVRALARRALELDPGIARGELLLGIMDYQDWLADLSVPDTALEEALGHMRRSVAMDPNDFYCHVGMGEVCLYCGAHDRSERHLLRAMSLNPNRPSVHMSLAHHAFYSGRPDEALERAATARRIDPYFEPRWLWSSLMMMSYAARRYAEALDAFKQIDAPRDWVLAYAAAAHANMGNSAKAAEYTAAALQAWPSFTITASLSRDPFRNPADRDHVAEGMRRAGLPD